MTISTELQNLLKSKLKIQGTAITSEVLSSLRNTTWGGVPEPTPDSLYPTVEALKEGYETLVRQRGEVESSAVLVQDLINVIELIVPYILDEVGKKYHP
jgi:hypothetical protein